MPSYCSLIHHHRSVRAVGVFVRRSAGLEGEYGNIVLLLLLYTLQGVPMGISAAIPMLLQDKNVPLSMQGVFSLASWPFSIKLLW